MSTVIKRLGLLTTGALVAGMLSLQGQAASSAGEPGAAPSAPIPDLITAAPAGAARQATLPAARTAARERLVGFNARALQDAKAGSRIALGFFGDKNYVARVEKTDSSSLYQSWSGRLEGVGLSTFVAVRSGDVYRAIAMSPEGTYTISSATGRGDVYRTAELKPEPKPTRDDQLSEKDVPRLERLEAKAKAKPSPRTPIVGARETTLDAVQPQSTPRKVTDLSARKDSKKQVDIAFTFSPQMVAAVGSTDAANSYAALAVALNNQAFVNSGIPSSWRLVGTMVGPNEIGDFETDLTKVSKQKGKYKRVKKFRKKTHADAVSNLITGESLCGIAWIDVNDGKHYWKKPYSIVNYDCVDYMTVSHEVGHNYGASHDPYALQSCPSCGGSAYKYGKALVSLAGQWFTIVAYPDQCYANGLDCSKVAYFSNPKVAYNGISTGAKKQYNAKVIKKKSKRMARFNLGQIYPSKVKLKGKAKPGKKLKVKTKKKKWSPKVKLKFRWYVNGAPVPGKKGKKTTLKLKKKWKGMQVYCVVTGKAHTYTPVSVQTKVKVI